MYFSPTKEPEQIHAESHEDDAEDDGQDDGVAGALRDCSSGEGTVWNGGCRCHDVWSLKVRSDEDQAELLIVLFFVLCLCRRLRT